MAASLPASYPAHNWMVPATFCTSPPITVMIALSRICLATSTNWVHKCCAVHMCLQAVESRPDGPADPFHQRAARWIVGPVISSKITGCVLGVGSLGVTRASRWIG